LIDGVLFATDNVCTHADALLSDGSIEGNTLLCPLHGGGFDVRTGAATMLPCVEPITAYPAKRDGESVLVDIS